MALLVVALMDTRHEAQEAIRELLQSGYRRDDVGFLIRDFDDAEAGSEQRPQGIGGMAGLVGHPARMTLPGIGPVLGAGPLVDRLTGIGSGARGRGILDELTDAGVQEDHAHFHAEGLRRGGVLVTVRAEKEMASRAKDILERNGAVDVSLRTTELREKGWERFDERADPYPVEEMPFERAAVREYDARTRKKAVVVEEEEV
jgi:hypothetical protein